MTSRHGFRARLDTVVVHRRLDLLLKTPENTGIVRTFRRVQISLAAPLFPRLQSNLQKPPFDAGLSKVIGS
jgi:hypothetical protein